MERKRYLDYLRVFACLAVMVTHVTMTNWSNVDVNGFDWQIINFYDGISRWCVAAFAMISGALFLNRDIAIVKIYTKYIPRMVVAFFVWGAFYYVFTTEKTATGHFHLWYIKMIIGFYICVPIIRKIVSDIKIAKYFLIVSFVFAFLLPWMVNIVRDFLAEKIWAVKWIADAYVLNFEDMHLDLVLGYTFYFVLGYFLDNIELEKKSRIIVYLLGGAGFVFTVVATSILALKTHTPSTTYYRDFNVNVVLEVVFVATLIKYYSPRNDRIAKWFASLSKYTFGAYLIHEFIIEKMPEVVGLNTLSFSAIASVPVIVVIVFVLSYCISAILNHIPIVKKYCV